MNFQKFIFDNEFWAFLYRQGCLKILLCKTQSRNLKFRKFCNFHCNLYLKFEYETFGSKHIIWFRIRTFSTDVFWNESFVVAHYVAVEVADSEICSQPFFEVYGALLKIYDSLVMTHKLWTISVHRPDRFMCIGDRLYSMTFGDRLYSTTFGDRLYSITFGDRLYSMTFGELLAKGANAFRLNSTYG